MNSCLTDRNLISLNGKELNIIVSGIQISNVNDTVLIQILVITQAIQPHIEAFTGHRNSFVIHDLDPQILFYGGGYQRQTVAVILCSFQNWIYFLIKKRIIF